MIVDCVNPNDRSVEKLFSSQLFIAARILEQKLLCAGFLKLELTPASHLEASHVLRPFLCHSPQLLGPFF